MLTSIKTKIKTWFSPDLLLKIKEGLKIKKQNDEINYKKLLIYSIIIYLIVFSVFCFWKYFNFGYNGLDLAIYNQVFYNSAHGRLFQFSIHPQSYLGDHLELFMLFLLPIYFFFQNPLMLLFLQTLFLALAAWPIFLICRKFFKEKIAFFITLIWFFNPFVQNTNLFEFHLLPFALFFIFFAFYFYQEKKIVHFIIFLLLSLLVREDVALVTLMFGFLALIEKREKKWILWPIILSIIWFILALKIIAFFTPTGQYKFLYYYNWLGNNLGEVTKNLFLRPLLVLQHLFIWPNFFFLLGLLLPFCYLVLLQPMYLLLAVPVFVQMLLGSGNSATIILDIHYTALFLPALFLALIFEIKKILENNKLNRLEKFLLNEKPALVLILSLTTLYACLTLGPILGIFQKNFRKEEVANKNTFLKEISANDSVATSFEFLTELSSRKNLYSFHYAFIGKEQLSERDYSLPDGVDKILVDTSDLLLYNFLFNNLEVWQKYYSEADNKFREFINNNNYQVAKYSDSLVLWEKNVAKPLSLYQLNPSFEEIKVSKNIHFGNGKFKLMGWNRIDEPSETTNFSFYFQALNKITENYNLRLILIDENGLKIYQKDYPLAYGIYPLSDLKPYEILKINYRFILPENIQIQNKKMAFQLIEQEGYLTANKIKKVVPQVTMENILGEFTIPL